ncbi:hypothetical protein AM593_00545, partial [Mytilus galloprovincialis]
MTTLSSAKKQNKQDVAFGQDDPTTFRKENFKSKKTGQQTHFAVKVLSDFIVERGMEIDILEATKDEIANLLQDFYANIRNKSQEYYKKNTLLAIRQSINRYLKENDRRGQDNLSQLKVDEFKGDSDQKRADSAKLSREYTNHCIRSTCITLLDYSGFQSRHIKTISGHRNEASLSSNCYDTSDKQKKIMSDALSKCTYGTLQQTESRSVTISLSQENTVSTFTSDENEQPIPLPVIETVSAVRNSKRQVENSDHQISAPKQMKMMPLMNISNCTVNINYYNN